MANEMNLPTLFREIKELNSLEWNQRERLVNLMDQRIWLLQTKLKSSPFLPTTKNDPNRINTDFAFAFNKWLNQFPIEFRLGALALGLSVKYIAKDELENFLHDCASKFDSDYEDTRRLIPYPLTDRTDIYGDFVHRIGAEGTSDRNLKTSGPIEKFVFEAAYSAYLESQGQRMQEGYFELDSFVKAIVNSHYILIEDWSLSGKTFGAEVRDLLLLFDVLLGDQTTQLLLRRKKIHFPKITIVVPFATQPAIDHIQSSISAVHPKFPINPRILTGFVFESNNRLGVEDDPDTFKLYSEIANNINWHKHADEACTFYCTEAQQCPEHDEDEQNIPGLDTLKYGYGKAGWTIVGFSNCPDNSLPLLWRSYRKANGDRYIALFPRIRSKITHKGSGDKIRTSFHDAHKDPEGKLRKKINEIVNNLREP